MVSVVKRMRALKNLPRKLSAARLATNHAAIPPPSLSSSPQLYALKFGPGGAVLPANITRIHMEFGLKNGKGHVGPTKFWRDNLPRLKYWNPSVPMLVNRSPDDDKSATMSIYLQQSAPGSGKKKAPTGTSTTTPTPTPTETATAPAAPAPAAETTTDAAAAAATEAKAKQAASRSAWDGSAAAPPPVEGERVVTIDMTHMRSEAILAELVTKTGAVPAKPGPEDDDDMAELAAVKRQGAADREQVEAFVRKQKREKALLERARKEADAIKAANAM
ncbi:hypothetical protein RB594_007723 [Gaeumannomyces avenae]